MDDEIIQDDPAVRFSVRELLARIDGKIDSLTTSVALKADKVDLDRIESRLDGHDSRLMGLETWKHDKEIERRTHEERDQRERAKWGTRERVMATLVGLASAAGILLGVFHP